MPVLYGHNMNDPDYNIGTAELVEDERGLRTTAAFDGSPKAQRVRQLLAEGRLSKMSFAYDVLDEAPVELEDGTKANELRRLDLFEVSVVLVPANGHAEIVESKARKGDEAQDDATTLGDVLAVLNDIRDDLRAIAANDDNDNGDDADEGGPEEPGTANDQAKSRDLIARLKQAIL